MLTSFSCAEQATQLSYFTNSSDASASVALNDRLFLIADDEKNILRIYDIKKQGTPVAEYDANPFLKTFGDSPEADIEAATTHGKRIYLITSHGRNKDGKIRPNRQRFFALDFEIKDDTVTLTPVGNPCTDLLQKIIQQPWAKDMGLVKAAGSAKKDQNLAPKEQGINIEGLAASPDGKTLYIAFRNPRPIDPNTSLPMALIIPLKNPDSLLEDSMAPEFDIPILVNLNGLSVRSLEYVNFRNEFLIIAGPQDSSNIFALYSWTAKPAENPALINIQNTLEENFNPEALAIFESSRRMLLLSDDGTLPVQIENPNQCIEGEMNKDGSCPNKFLTDPQMKKFRAVWLEL